MRILFLSNFYPPYELGGYEQWCQEMHIGLSERGHQVKVLTSNYGVESRDKKSVKEEVVRSLHLQSDINHYHPLDFFFKRASQERANIEELRCAIDQFQPDVLMVWGMWNLSLNLPYCAEQWMPGRVVYYIGSYWPMDVDPHTDYWQLPANHLLTKFVKRPLRTLALSQLHREKYPPQLQFEHAICCSQHVHDTLVQAGKLPPGARVLYGGSDFKPFQNDPTKADKTPGEPLQLLYFGRLIHDKGVHTAIEALGWLKQRRLADKVELTIIGSGHPDYEAYLRKMSTEFGIDDRIHFVGQLSKDELSKWLKRYDVFLFTSIWPEPFGRTIIEAMMANLVVIGSDVGGSREILKYYDEGLLFQAEDSQGLAERIIRVMNEPALRESLAQAGREMVLEKFSLERMVNDIERFILQVMRSQTSTMIYPSTLA